MQSQVRGVLFRSRLWVCPVPFSTRSRTSSVPIPFFYCCPEFASTTPGGWVNRTEMERRSTMSTTDDSSDSSTTSTTIQTSTTIGTNDPHHAIIAAAKDIRQKLPEHHLRKHAVSCQECCTQDALYQCPRCRRRTCSLVCCVAHKERFRCNGRRDRTAFINIPSMTDATLASDYHFLEDIVGCLDEASRLHDFQTSNNGTAAQRRNAQNNDSSRNNNNNSNGKRPRCNDVEHSMAVVHPLLQKKSPASSSSLLLSSNRMQTISADPSGSHSTSHGHPNAHHHPPHRNHRRRPAVSVRQRAAELGIVVLELPAAMERHASNQSRAILHGGRSINNNNHQNVNPPKSKDDNTADAADANDTNSKNKNSNMDSIISWSVECCWVLEPAGSDPDSHATATTMSESSTPLLPSTTTLALPSSEVPLANSRHTSTTQTKTVLLHNILQTKTVGDIVTQASAQLSLVHDSGGQWPGNQQTSNAHFAVLIKQIPCPAHLPVYSELEPASTLMGALQDRTVIEFPTLFIVPRQYLGTRQFPLSILPICQSVGDGSDP